MTGFKISYVIIKCNQVILILFYFPGPNHTESSGLLHSQAVNIENVFVSISNVLGEPSLYLGCYAEADMVFILMNVYPEHV